MEMRKLLNIVNEAVNDNDDDLDAEFTRDLANRQDREKKIPQTLQELNEQLESLVFAHNKVKEITRRIKHDDTVRSIIAEASQLAANVDIDARDFESAENEILERQRELESSVYGLDEVFKEAVDRVQYKIEELEDQIRDI